MYYAGFCAPLKSRATATIYRLYLSAIELLPIWIMFIGRIIDRIWISAVVLSTELLNPTRFVAYRTGGRGMRLPFDSAKFCHERMSTTQTPLYYTVTRYIPFEVYFLMVSKPDRITPQQMFFSTIWDISLWSNQWWVSLFSHPLIFFPFFRKHFNISHARCSRVRYQSIHESQIINIS